MNQSSIDQTADGQAVAPAGASDESGSNGSKHLRHIPHDRTVVILLTVLVALIGFVLLKPGIALDGISYFSYLHAAGRDGNLELNEEFALMGVARADFNMTSEGHVRNVFPIGCAVLWLPFYLVGHADALLLQRLIQLDPAGGYSHLHVFYVYVATTCMALVALVVSCRLATRLAGPHPALHATLAVWLAGPFIYYQYIEGDYAHVPAAFSVALFVALWYRMLTSSRWRDDLLLGLLGGVVAMVRWQMALVALLPLIGIACDLGRGLAGRLWRWPRELRLGALVVRWERPAPAGPAPWRLEALARGGIFTAGMLLGAAPQLIYWRVTHGSWLTIPQGQGFLVWHRPEIFDTLFSSYHGLFGWHPVLLLGVIGLVMLGRRQPRFVWPLLLLFVLETYVNSIAWDWEAGVSFGGRRFVALTILFIVGLAELYRRLRPAISATLTALLVLGNALLLYEFHFGLFTRRWYVSFGEILSQHREVLTQLPELGRAFAADHLGRLWPGATWAALLPALLLLVITALVLVAGRRARRPVHIGLLALLLVSEAVFVRAALVSRPSPIGHVRMGDYALIDFRWYENSHYHLDPFRPAYPGRRHFMGLAGKQLALGVIPFRLIDPMVKPLTNASAFTTCHQIAVHTDIELEPRPARAFWLVVDGGALTEPGQIAGSLELIYEDGSATVRQLIEGRDIWDYWKRPPEERTLWHGEFPADLTWLRLAADSTRTPRILRAHSVSPDEGEVGPGFTIFAVTHEGIDGSAVPVPIGDIVNTDYMQDPFRPHFELNHFPRLEPGTHYWRDVPYLILDVDPISGRGTTLTTAYVGARSQKLPLLEERSEWLHLAVDGAAIRQLPHLYVGDVLVHYRSGPAAQVHIQSGSNLWDYWEEPDEDHLLWRGSRVESLSRVVVPLDPTRVPRQLELRSAQATGNNGVIAGYAVFAITQKLAGPAPSGPADAMLEVAPKRVSPKRTRPSPGSCR